MRIGLVTPSWPGSTTANGITTAVAHLAAGLREIGHEITIIPDEYATQEDSAVINLPVPRKWTIFEKLIVRLGRNTATVPIKAEQMIKAVLQAIHARDIEILIMEESDGIVGMIQKSVPIPVIVTLHGPHALLVEFHHGDPKTYQNRVRIEREANAFHSCAGVTAPSKDVLDRTIALYGDPGCPKTVIPNPISALRPLEAQEIRSQIRNLLFIGRFDLLKGGDTVINAFEKIALEDSEARLTFVGPDAGVAMPDGTLQQIGVALGALPDEIRARVDYRGKLDKVEIEALRYHHGIAIIGSRYENFPYVALEALSCGMPTVATAVGGLPEIIQDMETGLLVPAGDSAAMARACLRLIKDPDLAIDLAAKAHTRVAAKFSPAKIAADTEAFIVEVLQQA